MAIENILLGIAVLVLASVVSIKLSDRFSVPVLLLFLGVGILAGSEGVGRFAFDDPGLAKTIGIVALVFIIFSGGLDTNWRDTRPIVWPGVVLSTAGVLLTAFLAGGFAVWVLGFSLLEGLLLGAIISSTDAAAVFSILRSRRISLARPLRPLLEFESGSNDPMAIFLTAGFISILTVEGTGLPQLLPRLLLDMGVGAVVGLAMGWLIVLVIKRLRLEYEGLYPVTMVGLVLLTYGLAVVLRGNGILAVYLAGLALGRQEFPKKQVIVRFHDGVAWMMQIVMFVTLGLLVFPSRVVPLIGPGLLLAFLLMVVARPLSVMLCLMPFGLSLRKKLFVSWVGLRGSVPIILATFPLMAGVGQADTIFNIVFFVVVVSSFVQGLSLPLVARFLRLDVPLEDRVSYPIELQKTAGLDAEIHDTIVPYESDAVGRRIAELGVPERCLILLISRGGRFVIASGSTVIEGGDVLLVMANRLDFRRFQQKLIHRRESDEEAVRPQT